VQALIMAAGKGSRLYPLTEDKPKSFVTIDDKKIIDYQIELYKKNGINDIIIVTGHMHEMIEEYVKDEVNVRTVYNPFYDLSNVLTSFWFGMSLLKEDFIYSHADTIFDEPILMKLLEANGDIVLPIDIKPCGEEEMKIQVDENGHPLHLNKTMATEQALGEFIGVAKISASSIPLLTQSADKHIKNKNFSAFFEVALQDLINSNRELFTLVDVSEYYWNEIDFLEDYEKARENFHLSSLGSLFK